MPLLRAALGLLGMFFAYYLGRSAAGLYLRREYRSRTITWALRAAVCVAAIIWSGGLDVVSVIVVVLVLICLAAGARAQLRPPKDEDLVRQMFPDE